MWERCWSRDTLSRQFNFQVFVQLDLPWNWGCLYVLTNIRTVDFQWEFETLKVRLPTHQTIKPSKHIFQQDADQHQAAPTWAAWKWAVPSWFSLALIQLGEIKNRPEVVAQNPKVYFPRKNKYFLMCTINPSWVKSCQCKNWGSKFPGSTLLATEYLFVLNTIVLLLVNLRPGICHVWMS